MILGSIIGILLGSVGLVTYAMFTYNSSSTNNKLLVGDIYMKYKETNTLNLSGAMPSSTYDANYKFEFEIDGKNTTTNKDVWYEIIAKRGAVPDGKSESNRLQDKYLKFTLTKQIGNGTVETVVDGESWEGLTSGKKIYVDKIDKNINSTTHKYVLYMWISNKVGIGTNTTYTISEWNNLFASIKVDVNGDFTEKTADEPYQTVNAMSTFPSVITDQKANIKEVYFNRMKEDAMQTAYNNASIKADLTYNNEGKVLAWLETNQTDNTKYNLIVASDGDTYFPASIMALFNGFGMTKIEFNNVNTSRVTAMTALFVNCSNLTLIDLSDWNTNIVTSMDHMFSGCSNLVSVNLSNLGSNVLSGFSNYVFNGCSNLRNIDMTNFNFGNVTMLNGIFGNLSNLESVTLNNANVQNITQFGGTFANCANLTTVDFSVLNLNNNLITTQLMFSDCTNLSKIYVSNTWNISNVSISTDMFKGCSSLVGQSPNTTYAFTDYNTVDKTYARVATDSTVGYLTDIALKPAS